MDDFYLGYNLLQEIYHKIQTLQTHKNCVVVSGESSEVTYNFVKCLLDDVNMREQLNVYKPVDHSVDHDVMHEKEVRRPDSHVLSKIGKTKISNRRRRLPLEASQECDPCNILQESVSLLVLPERVDDDVMSDVESAQPAAFVFLLKDVKAGEHSQEQIRYHQVIHTFHQMCSRDGDFDPSAAMFVIQTEEGSIETQDFKHSLCDNLLRIWPGVCDRHVFFTGNSEMPSNYDTNNELVDTFNSMIQENELRKIRNKYVWLKSAIPSMTRYIRSLVSRCVKSGDELESYLGAASQKQERLMVAFTDGIQKLEDDIEARGKTLKESILRFLETASTKVKNNTKEFNIVDDPGKEILGHSNRCSQVDLDLLILTSLLGELNNSVEIREFVRANETEVVHVIQNEFNLLEQEVDEILKIIVMEKSATFDDINLINNVNENVNDDVNDIVIDTVDEQLPEAITHDERRTPIICQVLDLLTSVKRATPGLDGTSGQAKDQEALKGGGLQTDRTPVDDELLIQTRVDQIMTQVKQSNVVLNTIIDNCTAGARGYLASTKNAIAKILSDNARVIEEICSCRETFRKGKGHLMKVMEELEPIRYLLQEFGTDFMEEEHSYTVNVSQDQNVFTPITGGHTAVWVMNQESLGQLDSDRPYFEGLWCRTRMTSITVNDLQENVLIRSYSHKVGKKQLISEVAKIRCLESSFIAPLFGVSGMLTSRRDMDETVTDDTLSRPGPVLIFRGDLVPCRVFMSTLDQSIPEESGFSKSDIDMETKFVFKFVPSLLMALDYIHKHGLVHMELTLKTVMVERNTGEVKLCQMCLPGKVQLPKDPCSVQADGYICLSPSVLRGGLYEAPSDTFAFGLLLWELLYPQRPPYREQRDWTLEAFINKCSPTEMLQSELITLRPSVGVDKILSDSLQFGNENCIKTPEVILRLWNDLKDAYDFTKYQQNELLNLDTPNVDSTELAPLTNRDSINGSVTIIDYQQTRNQTLNESLDVEHFNKSSLGMIVMAPESNQTSSPGDQNRTHVNITNELTSGRLDNKDILSCETKVPSGYQNGERAPQINTLEDMQEVITGDQELTQRNRRKDKGAQTFSENINAPTSLKDDSMSRLRKDDLDRRHSLSSDAPDQIANMLSSATDKSQKQSTNMFFRLFKKMTPSRSYDFDHFYDEPSQHASKLRISRSERGTHVIANHDEVVRRKQRSKSNDRADVKVLSFRISQEM